MKYKLVMDGLAETVRRENSFGIADYERRSGNRLSFGITFSAPDLETAEKLITEGMTETSGGLGRWHIEEVKEN